MGSVASPGVRTFVITRLYLGWVGIQTLLGGLVMLIYPHWYRTTSYDFARDVLPLEVWGVVWTITGAICLTMVRRLKLKNFIASIVLISSIHLAWSVSIFTQTFNGSTGAFLGAMVWLDTMFFALLLQWAIRPWIQDR